MRILLLGEYSSLHKFLKDGLEQIGENKITLISGGNGWKKIPGSDIEFPIKHGNGVFSHLRWYYEYLRLLNQSNGYDIVQFINAGMFPRPLAKLIVRKLRNENKCLSLLCAGDDYEWIQVYKRHLLKFCYYDYDKSFWNFYDMNTFMGRLLVSNEKFMASQVDILIPSLYAYSLGYAGKYMYDVIPFPINLDGLEYQPNIPKEKVVFFHGINREIVKGTPFIREALNRLAERYPNDVEVIINRRMPYNEYIQAMKKTNVILDQCCGDGYGINACLSMAQGKVTMVSISPELPPIKADSFPMIPIEPDVDQIYSQLEFVLENRNKIEQWGYESRKYVKTYHECKMIAQKYIDAWKSTGKV